MPELIVNQIIAMNSNRKRRILCVDDDSINQMVIEHMLRPLLFEIDLANSGVDALKLVKEHRYDLILLDIFMPEMSGLETAAAIRALDSYQPPIILISAGIIDDLERQMQVNNIQHFLTKPLNKIVLQETILGVL